MRLVVAAAALVGSSATISLVAQPESSARRAALESRRELLAARLAEIDAELAGELPSGTVRLFGPGGAGASRQADPFMPERRDGFRDRGRLLDAETRERMLTQLDDRDPELATLIRQAIEARGDSNLPVFGRIREMDDLREKDPEAFAARRDEILAGLGILRLASTLRNDIASDADAERIERVTTELRGAIASGFDAKREVLRIEIERSQHRTDDLIQRFERAESKRSELIEEHTDRLLRRIRTSADRTNKRGR